MTALRKLLHIAALLCLACAGSAARAQQSAPGPCRPGNNTPFSALDRIHVRDEFRIVYAAAGPHALADLRDLNANGIPDKVEDVATQLVAGRRLFSEVMGLAAPLRQPRYAQATAIDVFMLKMEKGNGLAYDEVMNYRLAFDSAAGRCALRIDLLNSRSNRNPTPVHELFHLYQYGYTMFKPRWFLEGTARWAEHALRPGSGPQDALPLSPQALQAQLFGTTYAASKVWNRLAFLLDPVGRLRLPPGMESLAYVDGTRVIHDDELHGAAFMKALLESLASLDRDVGARQGWPAYQWKEADQRSARHDAQIFKKVQDVVRVEAPRSNAVSAPNAMSTPSAVSPANASELDAFLALTPALQKDKPDEPE
jgi:hypothetical protein